MAILLNLRSAPSGALFVGENEGDTILWDAAALKWKVGPGGGGGVDSVFGRIGDVVAVTGDYDSDQVDNVSSVSGSSVSDALETLAAGIEFAPIQQRRFYDAVSSVTPRNGSIRAPWNTFAAFWAAIGTAATGGWELSLPGTAVTIDGVIPAFSAAPTIGLRGVAQAETVLNSFAIPSQAGATGFQFRDMTLTSFVPQPSANLDIYAENVTFGLSEASGTLTGTMRLRNCICSNDFGFSDMVFTADNCRFSGSTVCRIGSLFNNCTFAAGSALSFSGDGLIRLVGCDMTACTQISAIDDGTIFVDGYTWQTIIESGLVRSTQMVIQPVPHLFEKMAGTTENVSGNASFTYDLGEPTPRAEPLSFASATWPASQPSDQDIIIGNCSVDASGHIIVVVSNNTPDTITLTSPEFLINYTPRMASGT